jgi:sugar/nucleoside kinase (ribokinase family)
MFHMVSLEPVDYLVIGHVTVDLTPSGPVIGGSASYAALTACALGLRVGVVTVRGDDIPLDDLKGIPVVAGEAEHSTTFENIYTAEGRIQYLRYAAPKVDYGIVPEPWRRAKIIHLAPVAQEVDPILPNDFRPALLGLTIQGWLRSWDEETGLVHSCGWLQAEEALSRAGAAVFGVEDVAHDEEIIEQYAHACRLLAVTEGAAGVRLFWHGDSRRLRASKVDEVDPTGAGDVFAAAFFARLLDTRDPWEAARFANQIAAISVTRPGLQGVPTHAEVQKCLMEVLD